PPFGHLPPRAGEGRRSGRPGRGLQTGEAQLPALLVVRLRHRLRQPAHAQDVALALGDADRAARVEQVEAVAGLAHLVVGRQRQAGLDQLQGLGLAGVEAVEQLGHVGVLEVVGALLALVLQEHVAVGHHALRPDRPDQVVDVVAVLQVHAQPLKAVGDLAQHRPALQAAGLLEVGELGDLHAVEPDLPAQAPGAERGRFPVVLDQAQVVHQRIDPEFLQRAEVELDDVVRVGLHHHLVLVVVLQAVGVLAVAPVGGAARGLHVGRVPRLGPDRTQEGGRMEGAGADLQVERLDQHAALRRPVRVEAGDQFLERGSGHRLETGFGGWRRGASIRWTPKRPAPAGTEPRVNEPLARPSAAAHARLPPGRLALEPVVAALEADGLLARKDAEHARASARHVRGLEAVHPLVLLANLKLPSALRPGSELRLEALTEWLAEASGRPYLRIDPTRIVVAEVTDVVSHAYARRHRILPVEVRPDRVRIATSEPLALDWLPDIQRLLRREIELEVANPLDLHRYTMEVYGVTRAVRGAQQDGGEKGSQAPGFEQLVELGRAGDVNADDHHIVNIVDWLLQYAYEQRASDIHLEPRRDVGRVRFRIDGVLHQVFEMPPPVMTAVVSRIKVLGRMDLAERRRPQDGRIKTRSPGGREVEMRLS